MWSDTLSWVGTELCYFVLHSSRFEEALTLLCAPYYMLPVPVCKETAFETVYKLQLFGKIFCKAKGLFLKRTIENRKFGVWHLI